MSTVYMTLFAESNSERRELPKKKTVIITGGNRGVGLAAAQNLASSGKWNVVLACRSTERATAAKNSVQSGSDNIEVLQLDLSDLQSIKKFAKLWGTRKIDCLALNAGVHTGGIYTPRRSAQGFEETVATNHIGHFYLMQLLLPNVEKANDGRIVYVASKVHSSGATLGDLEGLAAGFTHPVSMIDGGGFNADKAYKDSKLCNVMTTLEMSRRLQASKSPVTCNCFSPGLIPTTGLFREYNPFWVYIFAYVMRYIFPVAVTEEEGGRRLAYMISSDDLKGVSGKYFSRGSESTTTNEFIAVEPSVEAKDEEKAKKLFDVTHSLIFKAEMAS